MVAIPEGVLEQVLLVFLVCLVELVGLADLCFNRATQVLYSTTIDGLLQLCLDLFGNGELFVIATKDPATILRSDIVALLVLCGRVYNNTRTYIQRCNRVEQRERKRST